MRPTWGSSRTCCSTRASCPSPRHPRRPLCGDRRARCIGSGGQMPTSRERSGAVGPCSPTGFACMGYPLPCAPTFGETRHVLTSHRDKKRANGAMSIGLFGYGERLCILTVSLGITYAVVHTYGCDDGSISPTRCAIMDAGLHGRYRPSPAGRPPAPEDRSAHSGLAAASRLASPAAGGGLPRSTTTRRSRTRPWGVAAPWALHVHRRRPALGHATGSASEEARGWVLSQFSFELI